MGPGKAQQQDSF